MQKDTHSDSELLRVWTSPWGMQMRAWGVAHQWPKSPGRRGSWLPHQLSRGSGCSSPFSYPSVVSQAQSGSWGAEGHPSHWLNKDRGGQPKPGLRPCHLDKGPCSGNTRAEVIRGQSPGQRSRKEGKKEGSQGLCLADPDFACFVPETALCRPNILISK